MPEPYTINGTITPTDGAERADVKVQAFDRDLPSLERRTGSAPQLLGEAITDTDGRFQITYTLEQFQSGFGISQFSRLQEQNADLSFRVFDRTGQELNIKVIEALNREFHSKEIIFNAPTPMEVNLFVYIPPEPGISEYEQLIAQIAPVIEDLPLVELSDEDVAFLIKELAFEDKPEDQQHLEWLRWSALLAQETTLPVEAFYGWARTGLPDLWNGLPALDDKDSRVKVLAKLLDQLVEMDEESLVTHLLQAVENHIIPSRIRERASAIANAIRRRVQIEVAVRLRLERETTRQPLNGYTVETFDIEANNRDLGTDVTDALGEFAVTYYVDVAALDAVRHLRFLIRGPTIAEAIEVKEPIRADASEVVSVRVPLPEIDPTLQQLRKDGHVDVPDEVLAMLEQKHGITSLSAIRRVGGLSRIIELRALDSAATRRLDALADLDRLSSDLNETSVLLDHNYDCVVAVAEASRSEFIALMSTNKAGFSERRATELHVAAKAQTDILDQILAGIAIDFASGIRPPAGYAVGDYFPPFPEEQDHD